MCVGWLAKLLVFIICSIWVWTGTLFMLSWPYSLEGSCSGLFSLLWNLVEFHIIVTLYVRLGRDRHEWQPMWMASVYLYSFTGGTPAGSKCLGCVKVLYQWFTGSEDRSSCSRGHIVALEFCFYCAASVPRQYNWHGISVTSRQIIWRGLEWTKRFWWSLVRAKVISVGRQFSHAIPFGAG